MQTQTITLLPELDGTIEKATKLEIPGDRISGMGANSLWLRKKCYLKN